ncbi:MAG TPA: DUF3089 domain-containing protein [Actinomycetota bacterium]
MRAASAEPRLRLTHLGVAVSSALTGIGMLLVLALAGMAISAVASASSAPERALAVIEARTPSSLALVTPPPPSPSSNPAPVAAPPPQPSPSPAPVPAVDAAGTVWLCRPGLPGNPCAGDLSTTAVAADGTRTVKPGSPTAGSPFDCFYAYPTVSEEPGTNADLTVQPQETEVATRQAAQFSKLCNVWAPMYRQRTMTQWPTTGFDADAAAVEYSSFSSAWNDYLAHFNGGRPIIFIGHSTGTTVLTELLQRVIDGNPTLRHRMVSALLMGGSPGGNFRNIPPCRSADQTSCVIGYNSYYGVPPATSEFGHPAGTTLCTNPAAPGGGPAALDPILVTKTNRPSGAPVSTPFVEYPGLYTAQCMTAGGATWLQILPAPSSPADPRPRLTEKGTPDWGLHADDVSLGLGNLLQDVQAQEAVYH